MLSDESTQLSLPSGSQGPVAVREASLHLRNMQPPPHAPHLPTTVKGPRTPIYCSPLLCLTALVTSTATLHLHFLQCHLLYLKCFLFPSMFLPDPSLITSKIQLNSPTSPIVFPAQFHGNGTPHLLSTYSLPYFLKIFCLGSLLIYLMCISFIFSIELSAP